MCASTIADHLKTAIPSPPPRDLSVQDQLLQRIIKEKQMEAGTLAELNNLLQAEINEEMIDIKSSYDRKRKNTRPLNPTCKK